MRFISRRWLTRTRRLASGFGGVIISWWWWWRESDGGGDGGID